MERIIEVFQTYPYFFTTLWGLTVVLFVAKFILPRKQCRVMVICGLLLIPAFPAAITYNYDYWSPVRLGGWVLGVEDILFSFLAGAGAWLGAVWPFRNKIVSDILVGSLLRRYGTCMVIGTLVFSLLRSAGLDSMSSTLALYWIWFVVLIFIKREFWPVALCGALSFGTVYPLLLKIVFWFWPDYVSQFSGNSFWSKKIFGLVLGELAWGVGFATSWPLYMAYIFNARIERHTVRD